MSSDQDRAEVARADIDGDVCVGSVCPNCGAALEEIRAKFHCPRCHLICETCCEGGR